MSTLDYALRYGKSELPLSRAALTIGRGSGCSVTLDDALVSRQHARVLVRGQEVIVEDLGSRNGVLVNGSRIEKTTSVAPGDRIMVGSVEFELLARPARHGGTQARATGDPFRTQDGPAPSPRDLAKADESTVHTHRPEAFELLGSVVERALRAGHSDEAERLLHGHVWSLLTDLKRGEKVPAATKAAAARHMVTVARGTRKGIWIDYLVQMYRPGPEVMPSEVIDDLVAILPTLGRVDVAAVRDYVASLRKHSPLGPERGALAKLPELERAAVLAATR